MIGALIGDIAAWHYEHATDVFYRQLTERDGGNAVPSAYGNALMKAASCALLNNASIDLSPIGTPSCHVTYSGQWLMWQIVEEWAEIEDKSNIPDFGCWIEKEEMYAGKFIKILIHALKNGATKGDAYYEWNAFVKLTKNWHWKLNDKECQDGLLTCVFRAWDSFYRGFDFTSTIHNAVKWPGERHLTTIIAAAFADAMYGCDQAFIKQKYAKNGCISNYINITCFGEKFGFHHALMQEMRNCSRDSRTFFPKNRALTNVERHIWKDVYIAPYSGMPISAELAIKILEAFDTDWDARYGVYLDDGWFYVYRSNFVLYRFKIENQTITNLQQSNDKHATPEALESLFYTLKWGNK